MRITRRSLLMGGAAMLATQSLLARDRKASAQKDVAIEPPRIQFRHARVVGPSAPIQILDDEWGVPHIRAETKADAFFGQGYAVARDRLFQIDYGYRRDQGRMAEAFGPDFLRSDERAALGRFRGDVEAEINAVPEEVRACAQAYVAGVNARIAEVEADPSLLPLEYAILNLKPLRWSLADLVAARSISVGNMDDEVRRAQLAAMKLLDLDRLVAPLSPAHELSVPDGLDVTQVGEADLGLLGTAAAAPSPTDTRVEEGNAGSNAWTIAPARSATGRPILANDPHLGIGGFSPRHVAHLSAPGLDVIGGGAPGLPGIMQGHTDRFAFGRTNSHNDQQDLFILDLNPSNAEQYWHRGRWRTFDRRDVLIRVKGERSRSVRLRYSVQGPVIAHDPARNRASAMAAVSQMPGASGIFAMVAINLASDWNELQAAFRLHPAPTNFHYADVDGNTAWRILGFVPVRKGGRDGLFPVPGDGRYDWDGRVPTDRLPGVRNPDSGWFASSNQNNLPENFRPIPAYSFREPYRYDRVVHVLKDQPRHAIADSAALQQDYLSLPAREFMTMLPANPPPGAIPATELLRGWDGVLGPDSAQAALFELVWADLNQRLVNAIVPMAARELVPWIATSEVLRLMAEPDARFGLNPAGSRDLILTMSMIAGWEEAVRRMGPDPAMWRWDALHTVTIRHPLSHIPEIAAAFPPIEGGGSGGDEYSVNARWTRSDMSVAGGASYLQVIDVGEWDNSLYLNMPGQSGDPRDPHYRDMYQPWIEGRMQPMIYTAASVDAAVTVRTTLLPANPTP